MTGTIYLAHSYTFRFACLPLFGSPVMEDAIGFFYSYCLFTSITLMSWIFSVDLWILLTNNNETHI